MKRPEICIPITDITRDEIVNRAKEFAQLEPGMVEWRMDFFAGYEREIPALVRELKQILKEKKLIVTLRTSREGGQQNGDRFDYENLLTGLVKEGCADYVDVEIQRDAECVRHIIKESENTDTKIIGSYHDFSRTPEKEKILSVLTQAEKLGADVGKIACMPSEEEVQGKEDAQRLLDATEEMKSRYPEFPIITMSMGENGKVTRLYGGLYGSEVSFGCAGAASAPGQVEWKEMQNTFDKIYSGKKHISLIGFMGVGKTTISRELRQRLDRPEVDTDQRIAEQEGCPVSQIFEERGEPYFRQLETDCIDELALLPPSIISCGGGMALRDLNVKKLRAIGEIVLLTAAPETIYERVKDSTERPLLNGNMNVDYIKELMEKRRSFYEKAATVIVATDGRTVQEIAAEIESKVFLEKCQRI